MWRLLVVAMLVTTLPACGDEDAEPVTTPGQTATTTPGAERLTGDPEVDRVINILESRDRAAFESVLQKFPEACAASPQGVGSPPKCPEGVPEGTQIETFRWVVCERGYPTELDEELARLFALERDLYAAFRPQPGDLFTLIPKSDYALVFVNGQAFAERYEVTRDGRVTGMWRSCGSAVSVLPRMLEEASTYLVNPAYPLPTPSPTPGPDATGYPGGYNTGIAAVDSVLRAIESGNPMRILAHFKLQPVGCVTESPGMPSPPLCKEGQPAGTLIDAFPIATCEMEWRERDNLADVTGRLAAPGLRLWSVYRYGGTGGNDDPYRAGEYVVVLRARETGVGYEVVVTSQPDVVSVWFHCGASAEDIMKGVPQRLILLPPP